jgi:hypothetical protein
MKEPPRKHTRWSCLGMICQELPLMSEPQHRLSTRRTVVYRSRFTGRSSSWYELLRVNDLLSRRPRHEMTFNAAHGTVIHLNQGGAGISRRHRKICEASHSHLCRSVRVGPEYINHEDNCRHDTFPPATYCLKILLDEIFVIAISSRPKPYV